MRECFLQTLLLLLSCCTSAAANVHNNFLYHDILGQNGKKQSMHIIVYSSGVKLHVDNGQPSVFGVRGGNVTLPCRFWYEPKLSSPREVRVKWSWLPAAAGGREEDVLVAFGSQSRSFGVFRRRTELRQEFLGDAALVMTDLQLRDTGQYRCEVVDGLEDERATVHLELQGVIFPYQHPRGRYLLSFLEAQRACEEQDSTLASFTQLFQSWKEGLNWCSAGWLADATVRYPITWPRVPCGGQGLAPGVRSYGRRRLNFHRYDAFCFTSSLRGKVYYLQAPHKMNLTDAQKACQQDGAEIAKVGQLYAAWKLGGLDRCDAGWLADGSLRYPITRPRQNCGPAEPGVRSLGFPLPKHMHGVYCYESDDE
ncbi:hyaluronan and proteoglycan link protein 3-like [Cololabis saira]|uniref:hyaluronan and proteoglycan link protein 3-like n=1 Tax=Cololabis saira TaxID=129043 RepID=UPI002AD3E72E|nr:hyaluronan and proteoglycan link protein 3-like [Cololabis saira]